jgi:hypothetical protein
MLNHPDKEYCHKDIDLLDAEFYQSARMPFGEASLLPDVTYLSKNFSELEDEKLWTRGWIAVGCLNQIPNPGDLLPYTVGNHGIHVQRNIDGSLSARFNKAQHGGCRSIPLQCQTGKKTKCSYTSCGFSRDRDVISAGELDSDNRSEQQYIGLIPERLLPVNVDNWGMFVFVNLDPDCEPLKETLGNWHEAFSSVFNNSSSVITSEWVESACNWKLAARSIVSEATTTNELNEHYLTNKQKYLFRWQVEIDQDPALSFINANHNSAIFHWLFPNLILCETSTHIAAVILQPTGLNISLQRVIVISLGEDNQADSQLLTGWLNYFRNKTIESEKLQAQIDNSAAINSSANENSKGTPENRYGAYLFQQYLLDKLFHKHQYFSNVPMYMHVNR